MLEDKLEELDRSNIPVLEEEAELALEPDLLLELVTPNELEEEAELTVDKDVADELEEDDDDNEELLEFTLLKLERLDEDIEERLDEEIEEELDDEKCISGKGLSKTYTAVSEPSCIGSPLSAISISSTRS